MTETKPFAACPRACAANGDPIFRGLREDSCSESGSWWTPERHYAEEYADVCVIESRLPVDAAILDLSDIGVTVSGAKLDAAYDGLAAFVGLDADEEIEATRLWDVAPDKAEICRWLTDRGYDGLAWLEESRLGPAVAYLLVH